MKKYFSIINNLIFALLAFLGFSCDPNDTPAVEYGMPTADFKAQGTIISESTLQKLMGIEVTMNGDTTFSDENGNYEVSVTDFPAANLFTVKFRDVDGVSNGEYQPLDTVIDFSDVEFENGDGSWYSGEKTLEIDVKLNTDENK